MDAENDENFLDTNLKFEKTKDWLFLPSVFLPKLQSRSLSKNRECTLDNVAVRFERGLLLDNV